MNNENIDFQELLGQRIQTRADEAGNDEGLNHADVTKGCMFAWGKLGEPVVIGEQPTVTGNQQERLWRMFFSGMAMSAMIGSELMRSSIRRKGQRDAR